MNGDKTPQSAGQKVLIAIDASEHAQKAVEYYVQHLHKPANEIVLVNSLEIPYIPSATRSDILQEVFDRARDESKHIQERFKELLKHHGVESVKVYSEFSQSAGQYICETATAEKVNLIIMGTRGLGKIRRTILGSVSDYVMHHAHCAVLINRH